MPLPGGSRSPDIRRMSDSREILAQALAWRAAGQGVEIAQAVDESGAFVGSVSGGCVENAVIEAARDVVATGRSTVLEFGVADDQAWDVGLACGGKISIYLENIE